MQTLPGFRDFYPAECAARNYLFARWREVARRYGFVEYDGPTLEPVELYKKKSGGELVGQLFDFVDKGERHVALRPEMTPTLARMVAARERDFKKPLKWFSIAPFFRYEKQQKGRLREFYQFNCDLIGEASPAADAELIALAVDLLRAFGLTQEDFFVRVNDRNVWLDFLRARGLTDFVTFDPRIVRGLAYYTGVVFEVFDRKRKFRALAGGGRYDELIGLLSDGATRLPALGFAAGDVTILELLRDLPHTADRLAAAVRDTAAPQVYGIIADEAVRPRALASIQALRGAGLRVDFPLVPMKLGKQFQAAEQSGAARAVIYGAEWPQVKIKTLATRAEETVSGEPAALLAALQS